MIASQLLASSFGCSSCAALMTRTRPKRTVAKSDTTAKLTISSSDLTVETAELKLVRGIGIKNITAEVRKAVSASGVRDGLATILSRHTTTAICVNEDEERLFTDIQTLLLRLAPPDPQFQYSHNDIHLRAPPPNYTGDADAWRAQEPINAHAHLCSLLVGSSESLPVAGGELQIGTWQSVLLIELDGPRSRRVGVHVMGE